jgi:hypothetical protein
MRLDFTGRAYESVCYGKRLGRRLRLDCGADLSTERAGLYRATSWTLPGGSNWK